MKNSGLDSGHALALKAEMLERDAPSPIQLIGEMAVLYTRFGKAAIAMRATAEAHQKAQEEFKTALSLWTAACEKANGA